MANDPALLKAEDFLKKLIDPTMPNQGTSPIYMNVKPQVVLLCNVWMVLPSTGNPLAAKDPEKSLANLVAFGRVKSLQDIVDAADLVTGAYNDYFSGVMSSFIDLVGSESVSDILIEAQTDPKQMLFLIKKRYSDEVTKQNSLIADWTECQKKLTDSANKLSIPLSTVPIDNVKPVKVVRNPFQFLMVEDPKSKKLAPVADNFGWQSKPMMSSDSNDVSQVNVIWDYLFTQNQDPAVVKQGLQTTFGMNETAIADLFSRVYNLSCKQIEQCQKVMTNVKKDFDLYQGCQDTALQLQALLVAIGEHYGFTVGKVPSKKITKK